VFQCKTMFEASSMSFATAFAAGLIAAWGVVWSATWLVWNNPQFDAKRVQRRRVRKSGRGDKTQVGQANGVAIKEEQNGRLSEGNGSATAVHEGAWKSRKRPQANGRTTSGKINAKAEANGYTHIVADGASDGEEQMEYYWQSYPDNFSERFPWVADLLMNFRGPGWNWAIPPVPALPPSIKAKLGEHIDATSKSDVSSVGLRRFNTRKELYRYRMPQFVAGFFLLDILKTAMMKDPYFIFGPNTYAPPPHLKNLTPSALQFYRQALSSLSIITSLEMVFILAPLGFSLIFGPKVLGLRAESWYYPTTWGSFNKILDKGLNGLWGSWWHQTFRFAFSAPSNYLIANGYVKARSPAAKILALVFAFGISGFLHTGGSISQLPKTYPSHAPIFFLLQALGIVVQMATCSALNPLIRKFPRVIRRIGNFAFTWTWLYYTGWWLADDFARGGIWLYEPIPISPLRASGFGVKGDIWWCWEHIGVGWYTGKNWWESGVAI
jgi:hypothetical protein